MEEPLYTIEPFVSLPFEQNAYVIRASGRNDAIIVDPGFDTDALLGYLGRHGLVPAVFLNTHGHADHIAGNSRLKAMYPHVPLIIGKDEAHLLGDPVANLSAGFGIELRSPPADQVVDDGDRIELAGLSFLVRTVPGHSPGSVVFIADQVEPPFVIAGDVLFRGSVGRTDFPGGSFPQLASGIHDKLFILPDNTQVLPGHGPTTTIGEEQRSNPFVGGSHWPG